MTNKEIATAFLNSAAFGKVKEGYDKYVANNFTHHNQYFKGDRQTLLDAMADAHVSHPNKSFEPKMILEDGDKVMTYSKVVKETMSVAVVHIFRFHNGKIVELWDVGAQMIADSPNENGMF